MPAWNIAAAQYGVQPGNLRANISHHLDFIHHAAAEQIDLLVFPELSLTGYPQEDALSLAVPFTDESLTPLQRAAVEQNITVIVGLPLRCDTGVLMGSVGFLSDGSRVACCYSPQYNETACEQNIHTSLVGCHNRSIAMELSTDIHEEIWPRNAAALGADLYATGKFVDEMNYQHDELCLQRWAYKYSLPILFANHAFSSGSFRTAGRSACWDNQGQLVVRADCGELLAVGRRDEKGWHGEVIPLR